MPDKVKAAIGEHAPGIDVTFICFSWHNFTNLKPGSEISGVPESDTNTTSFLSRILINFGLIFSAFPQCRVSAY